MEARPFSITSLALSGQTPFCFLFHNRLVSHSDRGDGHRAARPAQGMGPALSRQGHGDRDGRREGDRMPPPASTMTAANRSGAEEGSSTRASSLSKALARLCWWRRLGSQRRRKNNNYLRFFSSLFFSILTPTILFNLKKPGTRYYHNYCCFN